MNSIYLSLRTLSVGIVVTLSLGALSGCETLGLASVRTTPVQLAEDAVAPAYQQWREKSGQLVERAQQFCATSASADTSVLDASALETVRAAWRDEALAWSYLQSMQPGPVTPVSVRVSYWPDKKDLVGHQVQLWLAQPLPTVAELADQSVTLQGLSALEFLLFDPRFHWSDAKEHARLCPRVRVIAERQQALTEEALQAWQQEQGQGMRTPLPNSRYATESEALAELLKANVSGLEVAHKKLVSALGEKYPQPFLAEYWRSGLSLASARAVLEGSASIWQSGLSAAVAKQDAALAKHIDETYVALFANALLANELLAPNSASAPTLTELLKSRAGRDAIAALTNDMKTLHLLYARDVSKALQIPLGINAHDGD